MKKKIYASVAGIALMIGTMAAFATPASADPGGNGCGVGQAVSQANQIDGTGIGNVAHQLGFDNVGNEVIQPYHATVKASC